MKYSERQTLRKVAMARMQEIMTASGDTLTAPEQTELDEMKAVITTIDAGQDIVRENLPASVGNLKMPRRTTNGQPGTGLPDDDFPNLGQRGKSGLKRTGDIWRATDGKLYRALTKAETFRDYFASELPQGLRADDLDAGRYLKGFFTGNWKGAEAEHCLYQAAGSTTNNISGAYLVPDPLSNIIIDKARAKSVILEAGAMTIPMDSSDLTLARVSGDPAATLKGDNDAFPDSGPSFDAVKLVAKTIGSYCVISRELAEDAIDGPTSFLDVLTNALAAEFDRQCLEGQGAEILGIIHQLGVNAVASVGTPSYDDLLDAILSVETDNHSPNAYILSPTVKNTLAKLKVGAGDARYIEPPVDVQALLRLVTTSCPDANAVVGEFTQAMVGLRQGVLLERTTQGGETFQKHQMALKATLRGDMALRWSDAFCVLSEITT